MKHLKLFENFTKDDLDNLVSGFEELGINKKKFLRIKFVGISVTESDRRNEADFKFHNDRILRIPISEFEKEDLEPGKESFSKTLQDSVLYAIRNGEAEVNPDCAGEPYIGDTFDPSTLISVAEKTQTLDEFWDLVSQYLYDVGMDIIYDDFKNEGIMEEFAEFFFDECKNLKPKFWIEKEGEKWGKNQ